MSDKTKNILEWIYCIVIAVIIAVVIKYFVGTPTIVRQTSMYPTLEEYDRLLLNRLPRTMKKQPERYDIITFEAPSNNNVGLSLTDLPNPVAKYENEPTNLFKKFTYHVLEIGKESYIKRVIGLPGEQVEIKDGKVYIDDKELEEPYLADDVVTKSQGVLTKFKVPDNCVFAIGDNREGSKDCRLFGCIPMEKIESKVVIRFWPFNKWGKVD